MHKTVLLVGSALLLGACTSRQPSPESLAPQTQQQAMNEFQEVSAAIQAGQSVRCEMIKTDGTETMTYLMKGKKMKMNTVVTAENGLQPGTMISDGEYFYIWNVDTNEGVKSKLPSEEDVKAVAEQQGRELPDFSKEEEKQKYEDLGYRVDCQVAEVADAEFVPPANVQFRDMSQLMNNVQQMMKQDSDKLSPEQQKAMEESVKKMMENQN